MENQNPCQEYSNVQQNNSIDCEANKIETECEESHIFTDSNTESVHYVNHACYYVQGKVDQVRLNFLVDSGSSICVLSEKVFDKICKDTVTLQETDSKVRTANGNLLKLKGVCTLQIQLDHLVFDKEFIVANIQEVQVGKDQEKAQSEKDSHSKNRGGKKPNQQSGTYTMKQS